MKRAIILLGSIIALLFSLACQAAPAVGSREYKLMLNATLFNGARPFTQVDQYWAELQNLIQGAPISRNAGGLFSLTKQRIVKFYDTPSSCVLKAQGYTFRERIENSQREVTLKFRSNDRFISGYKNMQGNTGRSPVTKFEEDISAPFVSKYSHSTTQSIGQGKNLNKMNDPIGLYSGLATYNFNSNEPIILVSGLAVSEKVYKGPWVDLGNLNASFSLTLWYDSSSSMMPLVAEISFKYKESKENYSDNVTNRALAVFEAMQSMSNWVSASSLTKTAFVFAYVNPSFCL